MVAVVLTLSFLRGFWPLQMWHRLIIIISFVTREQPLNALDGIAFHYSIYRSLTRFLGMISYDVHTNFVAAWNQMFVNDDFLNPATGQVDPRHMYGTSNFDVFRWPSLENGTQRSVLATFITSLIMPGIPLVSRAA